MMKLSVTGIWLKWMIEKWGKNGETWDDDDGGVCKVGGKVGEKARRKGYICQKIRMKFFILANGTSSSYMKISQSW